MPAIAKAASLAIISVIIAGGVLGGLYVTQALGSSFGTTTTASSLTGGGTITSSSTITSSQSAAQSTTIQIWSMPPPKSANVAYMGTWLFSASESQGETTIQVNANLTYVASSNSTFTFGDPTSLARVQAFNGTIVWQEVTTDLLLLQNVSYGKSFASQFQIPTSNLELNQNYTLVVYPQVYASNRFLGNDLEVEFVFMPLAST
jgi:hypothetical protein